jgi:pimeloyl-ACP methyl ester carboxylesterase
MAEPRLRFVEANGVRLRVAEEGEGPLVLLLHGWPECWYSWRHQLRALAEAGYRAAAPDMRGYGESSAPAAVAEYDIIHLTGDVAALIEALGEREAVVVGHDWGAIVAWQAALLVPERVRAVVAMSVPYGGRAPSPPLEQMRRRYGEDFFYILYFQQPGRAEAEFDADPAKLIRRLYRSPGSEDAGPPEISDPRAAAGGFLGRRPEPKALPPWLSQEDLDYYAKQFRRSGFRGGINYYRNLDRNWELTPQLAGVKVRQPAAFIAGSEDGVIARQAASLDQVLAGGVADLRRLALIPGAGHWVQQERPEEVNAELLAFLRDL